MLTVREVLVQAFSEEMERDEKVFIIGEEVGLSGGPNLTTEGLLKRFGPHRVVDTPISEAGFTGLAVGASYAGLRPIVDFMTWNFALQAIDHILNSCAKISFMSAGRIKCPIVFRGPSGFNPGYAAEHTQEFFSYYGAVPGLRVVAPYTALEHKALVKSAIRDNSPVIFLENEVLYDKICSESENMKILSSVGDDLLMDLGKARILSSGTDITVIGISLSLDLVEQSAKESQHSIEVINLISIRPLDTETILKSVKKTKKLIVVDYGWPCFGIASEISAMVYSKMYNELDRKIECLTGADTHVGYAESLERLFYPTKSDLVNLINQMML